MTVNLDDLQQELKNLHDKDHADMRRLREQFELYKIQTRYEIDKLAEENQRLTTTLGLATLLAIVFSLIGVVSFFF